MSNSSTSKRSIRFPDDDELCVYHEGAVMDIEEVYESDIWYQHDDMSHIKRKAVLVSKEANRHGFGLLLTNTYGNICDATQDALNTWSRNGNSRRGLERWINDEYATKRANIRRRTIQSVLRAQDLMREENRTEPDYTMRVLSRLSETFSRDSMNFSRAMGIADELAILNMEELLVTNPMAPVSRTKTRNKSINSVTDFDNANCRYVTSVELPVRPLLDPLVVWDITKNPFYRC